MVPPLDKHTLLSRRRFKTWSIEEKERRNLAISCEYADACSCLSTSFIFWTFLHPSCNHCRQEGVLVWVF